jgi:hypothetical protein
MTQLFLQNACKEKGFSYFTKGDYNLNLIAIRDDISSDVNKFNDTLTVSYKADGGWSVEEFPITTKPGLYWLKNFGLFGVTGTAILVPGQYKRAFKLGFGTFGNETYQCLVQAGNLKIYRDGDLDNTFDYNENTVIEGSNYQICVHRGQPFGDSQQVGAWSAGCQVFRYAKDFERFMQLINLSAQNFGDVFYYTLFNKSEL